MIGAIIGSAHRFHNYCCRDPLDQIGEYAVRHSVNDQLAVRIGETPTHRTMRFAMRLYCLCRIRVPRSTATSMAMNHGSPCSSITSLITSDSVRTRKFCTPPCNDRASLYLDSRIPAPRTRPCQRTVVFPVNAPARRCPQAVGYHLFSNVSAGNHAGNCDSAIDRHPYQYWLDRPFRGVARI